ncbi:MAG: exonuclease subunit SbcD [Muribaculaceae bacterium]|nr:exonuclease subunit SbcD [Muribaculaceae bacterium]
MKIKILATSDWHLGNMFHGNDRLSEHEHFLNWLLGQISEQQPEALLVAGDVFDNGNPSAAAQSAYYKFLAAATELCPTMQIVITGGNHDSANRLEAPRALLERQRVEVRGAVHRLWRHTDEGGEWVVNFDDLIIPLAGTKVAVLAVPYLRSDVVQGTNYSDGVNAFLRALTARARELYPEHVLVMMAHMYANGADIAAKDASEKIIIGGQEEVNMEGWTDHPDYLTCGHIHKRQHIRNTTWARYSGSVLPMSFAEKDYRHGIDLLTITDSKTIAVDFLEYVPQHPLCILPEGDEILTPLKLKKLINATLDERKDDRLDDNFMYVVIKVGLEKVNNDDIKELDELMKTKNAVLCKYQKIIPNIDLTTISNEARITSVDDILNRNPMETLEEAFSLKHGKELNERQKLMLNEILDGINL